MLRAPFAPGFRSFFAFHSARDRFLLVMVMLMLGGCTTEPKKPYDDALVNTYVELTWMYEKEKMLHRVTDSLYQVKVDSFFRARSYDQKTFKSVVEELSKYPDAWQRFMQEVTGKLDSVRTADERRRAADTTSAR